MLEDYLVTTACAAGSATLASVVEERRGAAALALGIASAATLALVDRSVAPATIGVLAALGAGMLLARTELRLLAAATAGLLAGLGAAHVTADGVPSAFAFGAFALVPAIAAWAAYRRSAFAPPHLRDEALLVVLGLGVLAAVVPTLGEGWRTAVALQSGADDAAAQAAPPAWTFWIVGGALAAGMLVSLGRRR